MKTLLLLTALLGALALSGCGIFGGGSRPAASGGPGMTSASGSSTNLIVTAEERVSGKVVSVNSDLRFVVLTFPVGQLPPLEKHLGIYRQGLKVGEIKISGPQADDSTVADIIQGEAAAGDTVRAD